MESDLATANKGEVGLGNSERLGSLKFYGRGNWFEVVVAVL